MFKKWKRTSIFEGNGRRHQFFPEMEDDLNFRTWKTTRIFQEMEDDLNFSGNGRRPQFLKEMEDDLNFSGNGRRPQFQEMEDDLNFSGNWRRLQFIRKWKTTKVFRKWKTTSIQYQLIQNISWLFLLANVDSKFPIKNNLQLNEYETSLTWAWHSSDPAYFSIFFIFVIQIMVQFNASHSVGLLNGLNVFLDYFEHSKLLEICNETAV